MSVQKASVCPLDCPDTCSLAVTVSGDRVLAVRGSKVNPITHGAICAKVANSYPEFVHGPNRLRYPLKRIGPKGGGNFERTSWEQALDTIRDRVGTVIERYGPQAVLPLNYAGPHGMLAGDSMSLRFFHGLGASLLSRNPLCGGIRSAAYAGTFGATPGTPLQQVRLGGLDRAFIDEHVLGFDAFMEAARGYPPERAAEISGVGLNDIRTLARWYKEASPAVIAWR